VVKTIEVQIKSAGPTTCQTTTVANKTKTFWKDKQSQIKFKKQKLLPHARQKSSSVTGCEWVDGHKVMS